MTEPIKKDIQRHVCECCYLVLESPEKKPYCPHCFKHHLALEIDNTARIDRMIGIMPKASISGLPRIMALIWEEVRPLIRANHDRS